MNSFKKIKNLFSNNKVNLLAVGVDFNNNYLLCNIENSNKKGIIPFSELTIYDIKDIEREILELVGTKLVGYKIEEDDEKIVVSRKKYMSNRIANYQEGDIIEATVTGGDKNSLYLDFDEGLQGKMYKGEITSSIIESPVSVFKKGKVLRCKITKIKNNKVYLSRVALYKNEELNIEKGFILKCRIIKKLDEGDGYFVEVDSNPTYSGIFDLNKYNSTVDYKLGGLVNLKVVEIKPKRRFKFRTNIAD